jgi:AraC-like DNA-binding protein
MLHGDKNLKPMRFFEVNDYILLNYKNGNVKYLHDLATQLLPNGIYFIETQGERIIRYIHENRLIEYSFRIIDLDDSFIIYIQGSIKVNDTKEEFYINERYFNRQFKNVMNAYNLKKIVEVFNEMGRNEDNKKDNNNSNDIDDFLSGKIK